MESNPFTAKWKMIDSKHFIAEKEGYTMEVETGRVYPMWAIKKDGVVIDHAMNHAPTKCELAARIQVERYLNKILNNPH